MNARPLGSRWSTPFALGLIVGVAGLLMVGIVGAVVGFFGGIAVARGTRNVLLTAGVALFVAAALTIVEAPLTTVEIAGFPQDRPLAEVAGAVAAVLLLAGLVGIAMRQPRPERGPARLTRRGQVWPPDVSTTVPMLAAAMLGALALWRVGDGLHGLALAVLVAVLISAAIVAIVHFRGSVEAGPE